jgi:hypothetical protein
MDLDLAAIGAIRAKALQDGYLVLQEAIADDVLALVGELPEHIKIITLTNFDDPVRFPIEPRFVDGSLDRPRSPAPADDADAMRAELDRLKAEMQRRG